jgi:hypothetical protein
LPDPNRRIMRLGQGRGSHDSGEDHDSDAIIHKHLLYARRAAFRQTAAKVIAASADQ